MIIGIDPGLNVTAVVWDDGYDWVVTKGKKEDRALRLSHIDERLSDMFRRIINKVESGEFFVFLEEVSFGSLSRSMSVMGEVNGVIKLNVFKNFRIECEMVSPMAWKKMVLGKGNIGKAEVKHRVESMWEKKFENQHLYDAWCIWKYGEMYLRKKYLYYEKI